MTGRTHTIAPRRAALDARFPGPLDAVIGSIPPPAPATEDGADPDP